MGENALYSLQRLLTRGGTEPTQRPANSTGLPIQRRKISSQWYGELETAQLTASEIYAIIAQLRRIGDKTDENTIEQLYGALAEEDFRDAGMEYEPRQSSAGGMEVGHDKPSRNSEEEEEGSEYEPSEGSEEEDESLLTRYEQRLPHMAYSRYAKEYEERHEKPLI